MIAACLIGLCYFAAIFSFAFAMGVARQLVVAPHLGATAAVLLEVPIIILASWMVARRLLRRRAFSLAQRGVMGGTAFILTMASEASLAMLIRGQSLADWSMELLTPLGLVGFAAQVAFGCMPILAGRGRTEPS